MWFGPIKYDNIVHTFSSFVMALIAYNFLKPYLSKVKKLNPIYFGIIILLIVAGLGAVNEMFEFTAVIFANAAEGVGGYFNNSIDLFFNALGAIIGIAFVINYHNKKK
jgi:uncharacterized membrane protein YjdF